MDDFNNNTPSGNEQQSNPESTGNFQSAPEVGNDAQRANSGSPYNGGYQPNNGYPYSNGGGNTNNGSSNANGVCFLAPSLLLRETAMPVTPSATQTTTAIMRAITPPFLCFDGLLLTGFFGGWPEFP